MKTLTLQEAHKLLEDCAACIVDDNALMYPSVEELTGELDNEFLYLSWTDSEGYEYSVYCIEENNQTIKVDNNNLILTDVDGGEVKLTLLTVKKLL